MSQFTPHGAAYAHFMGHLPRTPLATNHFRRDGLHKIRQDAALTSRYIQFDRPISNRVAQDGLGLRSGRRRMGGLRATPPAPLHREPTERARAGGLGYCRSGGHVPERARRAYPVPCRCGGR